jgi:hypothetical protein
MRAPSSHPGATGAPHAVSSRSTRVTPGRSGPVAARDARGDPAASSSARARSLIRPAAAQAGESIETDRQHRAAGPANPNRPRRAHPISRTPPARVAPEHARRRRPFGDVCRSRDVKLDTPDSRLGTGAGVRTAISMAPAVDEYREHGRHASRVLLSHGCESKVSGRGDCRRSSRASARMRRA